MSPRPGLHPSIPAIVFIIWACVVAFVFPDRLLNADGDMLRHIRHGEWMLQHGELIRADPFSFTRGGRPFVGFEYGSQLILALVHRAGGLAAVVLFSGLLVGLAYAVFTRFLLARGVDPFLSYLVGVVAALFGAVHWAARPHLFTLLGVMILLHFLEPPSDEAIGGAASRRRLWPLVPLFAIWANLHGGFLFGIVLFGIYFAGSVGEMLLVRGAARSEARARWRGRAVYYATAIAFASAATILTPNFLKLHRHIAVFFSSSQRFLLDNTHEFMSPDFHGIVGKLFLLGLLGVVGLLAIAPGRPTLPRLLLVLANVAFALQAQRNIPLFAATVFPVLALHFDPAWRRLPDWRGIRAVFERDARRGRTLPLVLAVTAIFVALAVSRGRVAGRELVPSRLNPEEFPVEVVARARAQEVQGRLFHDFIWGGYLLYAWPEQRVFIDGGTDFYGPELMRTYMDMAALQPGWRDSLARWDIGLALLPTGSAMVAELVREPAWRIRDCDPTAVLLERGSAQATATALSSAPAELATSPATGTAALAGCRARSDSAAARTALAR